MPDHLAIIIPGLGEAERFPFLTHNWRKYGIETLHHRMKWGDKEPFEKEFEKFLSVIDSHIDSGRKISLVGCSAGATAAMNALMERRTKIHKVVSICGALNTAKHHRSLDMWGRRYPSFREAAFRFEKQAGTLTAQERGRILASHALVDELVRPDAATLSGIKNILIPIPEHTLAILAGLTFCAKPFIDFILSQ